MWSHWIDEDILFVRYIVDNNGSVNKILEINMLELVSI